MITLRSATLSFEEQGGRGFGYLQSLWRNAKTPNFSRDTILLSSDKFALRNVETFVFSYWARPSLIPIPFFVLPSISLFGSFYKKIMPKFIMQRNTKRGKKAKYFSQLRYFSQWSFFIFFLPVLCNDKEKLTLILRTNIVNA